MSKVTHALRASHCRHEFAFVLWMCEWPGPLQTWGGYSCHERRIMSGEAVDCPMKGRRMHEAYPQAMSVLRRGLDESAQWDANTFQLGLEF